MSDIDEQSCRRYLANGLNATDAYRQTHPKASDAKLETRPEAQRVPRSKVLTHQAKQSPEAAAAKMMVEGLVTNAATAAGYSKMLGELDLADCMARLVFETQKVQGGNLASVEATLMAQAMTLNAMFTQLARETSKMTIVDHIDRFTRLAFKAQSQCRATFETLAAIKNPTMVFARHANIAQGPQQVNNTVTIARAGNPESEQIEQLEAHGERVDFGTTGAAGTRDQTMATVGTVNRASNR